MLSLHEKSRCIMISVAFYKLSQCCFFSPPVKPPWSTIELYENRWRNYFHLKTCWILTGFILSKNKCFIKSSLYLSLFYAHNLFLIMVIYMYVYVKSNSHFAKQHFYAEILTSVPWYLLVVRVKINMSLDDKIAQRRYHLFQRKNKNFSGAYLYCWN